MDREKALQLSDEIEEISDDIRVYVFSDDHLMRDFMNFFNCKRISKSLMECKESLEEITSGMSGSDEKGAEIASIIRNAGEIKHIQTFKRLDKVQNKLGGRSGGSGFSIPLYHGYMLDHPGCSPA